MLAKIIDQEILDINIRLKNLKTAFVVWSEQGKKHPWNMKLIKHHIVLGDCAIAIMIMRIITHPDLK